MLYPFSFVPIDKSLKKIPTLGGTCDIGFNIIPKFWLINNSCNSETNSDNL